MSTSRHPVALRLEGLVGGDARLLALVMGLPLVDGVFVALILSGALSTPLGALQVGLLIFGGSATVAVILADMDGTALEQARIVVLVGVPLIALAALQAALAPTIASAIDVAIIERFAALVIAAIAAKTASATLGEYLPSPGVIVLLGLLASLDPSGAELSLLADPGLVINATGSAVAGVAFALAVALLGPTLRTYVDVDRFRFGSAVALGLLPLAILGMRFGNAPLAVLAVTALFSFDPEAAGLSDRLSGALSWRESAGGGTAGSESTSSGSSQAADGQRGGNSSHGGAIDESYPDSDASESGERAPWL